MRVRYIEITFAIVTVLGFLFAVFTFGRPAQGFGMAMGFGGLTVIWALREPKSKLTWAVTAISGCLLLMEIVAFAMKM